MKNNSNQNLICRHLRPCDGVRRPCKAKAVKRLGGVALRKSAGGALHESMTRAPWMRGI
jgi:hypothetical protein